jgi:hypothetical protein
MDALERGMTTLKKTSKHWSIPISSFSNHLIGRTRNQKMGFGGLFTDEEDVIMIIWTFAMQKVGPFTNLQQLKLKVENLIQAKPIQSQNGVFENS